MLQPTPRSRGGRPPRSARGRVGAEVRRLLARRPWIYWAAVLLVGTITVSSVHARSAGAERARRSWTDLRPVLVATVAIEPGDDIADRVRTAEVPNAIAPDAAITEPVGTARQHVDAGSVVTEADVSPAAGPLALAPDGFVVVAVTEDPSVGAAVGEHVDLASEGVVLARDALVVGATADGATLIATRAADAAMVTAAQASGRVAVIRTP